MGLDMYLRGYVSEIIPEILNRFDYKEVGYWRKHPNLHGYIVNQFANGIDNCGIIHLTKSNIENIISAVKNNNLPYTTGFWFGKSPIGDEVNINDICILNKAIEWLEKSPNHRIFYCASW